MPERFRIAFQVRDYECDLQGVVNNAVYQNYLEHARHAFLKSRGIDFAALSTQGVNLVLVKAELEYKRSLKPGDTFEIRVHVEPEGRVRMVFVQEIVRDDGTLVLSARMTGTALDARGRPRIPEGLWEKILA
jgi:acyl-CoA thioester hydrolase